jgi:hydrogenase expression/formation protein HypE
MQANESSPFSSAGPGCPLPVTPRDAVSRAHGGGGEETDALVRDLFFRAFGRPEPAPDDAVPVADGKWLATTDGHAVSPLFFPGGDLGTLAVFGTVNDLAVSGARAEALTASFFLGEGLPMETLRRIVSSMARAAEAAGVRIVAGDTKVVPSAGGEETCYIATGGFGRLVFPHQLSPDFVDGGDEILLTGDVGRHAMTVLAARNGLAFAPPLESDCADLSPAFRALLSAGVEVHCARDVTRGGLSGVLAELAESAGKGMAVEEAAVPVSAAVRKASEVLGMDPLDLACEGRAVVIVRDGEGEKALEALQKVPVSSGASRIGRVTTDRDACLVTSLGTERFLRRPSGELLPRIC